jgi:hypothetical protein
VWYPREQQHKILQLDPLLRSWEVLLEAPDNDWRWECKWRIVRSSPPTVALTELRLAGLLVGDQLWSGFVTSTASPPIPDNQDRIISSRRYLLDCRVIGGTAPRSNCGPAVLTGNQVSPLSCSWMAGTRDALVHVLCPGRMFS